MSASEPRRVRLESAQLRVLAHPLRSRLLSALRGYGPATATVLAQRLRTNSGATSYHVRQLAEVGLVEEDLDRGNGRERWWRSAHDITSWTDTAFDADPDDRAASDWLARHHLRLMGQWVENWMEARREWPLAWREVADQSDYEFHLTPEQLAALLGEVHEVIARHRRDAGDALPGAERCAVLLQAFPIQEPLL